MDLHLTEGPQRQPNGTEKWTPKKKQLGTSAQLHRIKTTKKSNWKRDQESERPGRGPSSSWGHELHWPLKAEAWKTDCTVRVSTERTAKRPHLTRRQRTRFVCRPSSSLSRQSSWSSLLSPQTCLGKRPVNRSKKKTTTLIAPVYLSSRFSGPYWGCIIFFAAVVFLHSGKMPFIVKSADKMASTRRQDTYPSGGLSAEVTKWTEEKIVFLTWSSTQLDILVV